MLSLSHDRRHLLNLKSGEHTGLTAAIRAGYWINIIPAGGLILIPEATAGRTCGHPIQTTVALIPR